MKRIRLSTALPAMAMAALLSLSAIGGMAGYYYNSSGQIVYVNDSAVSNGQVYVDGRYYTAYLGTPTNYNYPYGPYYYGVSPVTYGYSSAPMDSLGGVTAPRATMIEARANNHYLGLYLCGMREDLMDVQALAFGMTATRLTFDQSLGRAPDKSLTLLMRAGASSVSDADQFALGVYGNYESFKKAVDEGLGSLTMIDKGENFRVTVELSSFASTLKECMEDKELHLKNDRVLIQLRPVAAPDNLGGKTANSKAYQLRVFLYDESEGRRFDISENFAKLHVMLRVNNDSRSVLALTDEDSLRSAEKSTWLARTSGEAFATGYVPAGQTFVAVVK